MSARAIVLDAVLTPDAAVALARACLDADRESPLLLDASGVETMSTPAVLTLVATIKSRLEDGSKVEVTGAGDPFVEAFTDLGLFSEMMKMEFV